MKSSTFFSATLAAFTLAAFTTNTDAQTFSTQPGQPDYYVAPATAAPSSTAYTNRSASSDGIGCLSRGTFSIGSRIGFSAGTTDVEISNADTEKGGNTALQLNISPSIGYFFADNFNFGLSMDYLLLTSKDKSPSASGTSETYDSRLLFGPFMRLYLPLGDDQAFFLGGVSGFGHSNTQVEVDGQTQIIRNNIVSLGVGPGYTIIASNCFALESQVKYNYGVSRNSITIDGVSSTTTSFSNAFDFVVGFSYYFSR